MGVSSKRACFNIYGRKIQIEKGCIMAYDTPSLLFPLLHDHQVVYQLDLIILESATHGFPDL